MISRLLIAGNPLPFHVGAHFLQAASALGLQATIHDTRRAFASGRLIQAVHWRLLDKRPARMGQYGGSILEQCQILAPDLLLSIGTVPITASILRQIGARGIQRAIFLTDDPFNPVHHAAWFHKTLPHYDYIFSPRRANLSQLRAITNATVTYLPFAYNPSVHFPAPIPADERQMGSDILFAGGADVDRLPWIEAFIQAGMAIELYGGYWDRYAHTRPYACGHADLATLRRLIPASKINLGLVRRANRDGHVMRSFEVPAMGGLLLAEDTTEHRDLFGADGERVLYFADVAGAVERATWLLAHPDERRRLAAASHTYITSGAHTYRDRLQTILDCVS